MPPEVMRLQQGCNAAQQQAGATSIVLGALVNEPGAVACFESQFGSVAELALPFETRKHRLTLLLGSLQAAVEQLKRDAVQQFGSLVRQEIDATTATCLGQVQPGSGSPFNRAVHDLAVAHAPAMAVACTLRRGASAHEVANEAAIASQTANLPPEIVIVGMAGVKLAFLRLVEDGAKRLGMSDATLHVMINEKLDEFKSLDP